MSGKEKRGEKMKLNILIIFLLSLIFIISSTGYYVTQNKIKILKGNIQNIKNKIDQNDWQKAEEYNKQLVQNWDKTEKFFHLIIDHESLHNLEISLIRLEFYLTLHKKNESLLEIHLSNRLLDNIKDQEKLSLGNIF